MATSRKRGHKNAITGRMHRPESRQEPAPHGISQPRARVSAVGAPAYRRAILLNWGLSWRGTNAGSSFAHWRIVFERDEAACFRRSRASG